MKSNSNSHNKLTAVSWQSILEASSIGCVAYSRLTEAKEGVAHGVFDKAINILLAKGLVSLVPEIVERGPLNVTLRLPVGSQSMSSLGVRNGDTIKVKGFTMELGDRHIISFDSARIYSPKQKFPLPMLADDEIEANREVMRKTALQFGNMAGLGELLSSASEMSRGTAKNLNLFCAFAHSRLFQLEQAFRSGQETAINEAIRELIGLGPGLTPSSDDMLSGLVLLCLLYAKNKGLERHASELVAKATIEEVHGRTTTLSEEYLKQAALGRGNEPVMRLCSAILTGRPEIVEQETRRVLAIGETSGTDTVLGIAFGVKFCMHEQSILEKEE